MRFHDRIEELIDAVGDGDLEMSVVVDQVYARYQHQRFDLKHPRGGKPFFLRDPMVGKAFEHMQKLADGLITESGSRLASAAREVTEDVSRGVFVEAPVEYGPLRDSAHPTVTDGGVITYDRPPVVKRLTDAELRTLSRRASRVPGARQRGIPRPT